MTDCNTWKLYNHRLAFVICPPLTVSSDFLTEKVADIVFCCIIAAWLTLNKRSKTFFMMITQKKQLLVSRGPRQTPCWDSRVTSSKNDCYLGILYTSEIPNLILHFAKFNIFCNFTVLKFCSSWWVLKLN